MPYLYKSAIDKLSLKEIAEYVTASVELYGEEFVDHFWSCYSRYNEFTDLPFETWDFDPKVDCDPDYALKEEYDLNRKYLPEEMTFEQFKVIYGEQ